MSTSKPAQFSLEKAIRSNILALQPYRCARDDYDEGILLDANENANGHSLPPAQDGADEGELITRCPASAPAHTRSDS